MANLRLEQMEGTVKTVKANKSQDHQIDAHEKHLVHVQLEIKTYNQATGAKESEPFIQKFTQAEFKAANDASHFRGYSVDVLHDPSQGDAKATLTADTEKQKERDRENQRILNAAKSATAGTSEGANEEVNHKSLVKLGKPALQAQYETLYGEKPDGALTVPKLADAILERMEFLEEEAKDAKQGDGTEGTGEGAGEGDVDPNATF